MGPMLPGEFRKYSTKFLNCCYHVIPCLACVSVCQEYIRYYRFLFESSFSLSLV